MMPVLRPYQVDVIERVRAQLRKGMKRVIIQGATGSGKTTVSSEIVRCAAAKGTRTLFLAHRRRLIQQKSDRLKDFGVEHGIIMRGVGSNPAALVQVASRDTLLSRAVRNEWIELPPAGLVIVDEAHHCSSEYQALLENYRASVILGLSATPALPDGRSLHPHYQAMECTVPTSQLVREGYLVPVRCYAPLHMKKEKGQRRKLSGDPVAHWKLYGEERPTVLFAAKVEASLAVCAAFNAAGIPAEHLDASTPDEQRESAIARLQAGQTRIICNVGIYTEGVDVPCLSCCVLLRMASSYTLYAQTIGRVMRSHPGKQDAILIDHSGACLEHGFPDEDVAWSLDPNDTVDDRMKQARKDGRRDKPVCCPRCAFVYTARPACPACGFAPRVQKKPKDDLRQSEILAEVSRGQREAISREEKIRYWHKSLAVMAAKGRTTGAAAQMYRARFKEWPSHDMPNVPYGNDWRRPVADLYPQYLRHSHSY